MAKYKRLPPIEKETIILWNEAEDVVYIDTFNSNLIKRLEGLGKRKSKHFKVSARDQYGAISAEIKKDCLRVSLFPPPNDEKSLTDQHKETQAN